MFASNITGLRPDGGTDTKNANRRICARIFARVTGWSAQKTEKIFPLALFDLPFTAVLLAKPLRAQRTYPTGKYEETGHGF